MNRRAISLAPIALTLLITLLPTFTAPAESQELKSVLEEIRTDILEQFNDYAIDSCNPPCTGLICCDNGTCVHSVLACGAYPVHLDSFRFHASTGTQAAGFATQGILAAEFGREAQLWFGQLDGEEWSQWGIEPGLYEMVLREGAIMDQAIVGVVDGDGREVARLGGHFWVFSTALDSASEPDWNLTADSLELEACNEGRCVYLQVELTR